jgi:hypothetical protein
VLTKNIKSNLNTNLIPYLTRRKAKAYNNGSTDVYVNHNNNREDS